MRNLPSEYQEVEYIQSSGTQYIDTGYMPTNNTKVELKMGGWTGFGSYPNLFGARLEWSTTGRGIQLGKTTTGSGDYFAMFGGYLTGLSPSTFSFGDGNDHIIEMSQSGIYEDGALKQSLSSATFTSPTNMVIFADNENGTVGENGAYKLYYCQIYNNGTLVRDFVPCYRKLDNVIGLYDLVNNQFYINSGTGTFTKGSDVKGAKIQRIYIGTDQVRPTWNYSYTFKGKTAAEIGNEWTTMVGTPSVNSEGFNGNECIIAKDIPSLATVKRITITGTVVGQGGNNTAIQLGLGKGTGWGTGGAFYEVYGSSYGGLKVKYYDGTSYTGNAVGNATNSTYKPTLTIDLENKIITGTLSGFSNSTYSINDTQVSNIRTFTHLHCYVSSTSGAVSDISIKIEY